MTYKLTLLLFVLSLSACRKSKEETKAAKSDEVRQSMDLQASSLLSDPKITSLSIGIYKKGEKYTAHYGELDKGRGNQPSDSTIYEIASVSKTFTGILVANAVLQGKLKLEDPVQNYLNEDVSNFKYKHEPVKIKHLLTHTSGLPKFLPAEINDLFSDFNEGLPFRVYEIQSAYNKSRFFSDLQKAVIDTFPGTVYSYSNVDTEIMAQILENVYDQPFDEILKTFFKEQVEMQNTQISLSAVQQKHLANGYGMTGKLVPHEAYLYGADGGVKTTMTDLVKYMQYQLDSANTIVSEAHKVLYQNENRQIAYYLPVRFSDDYGTYFSMHGGAFGSQNWLFIIPKYQLGISVITNQSDLETADKLLKTVKGLIADLQ